MKRFAVFAYDQYYPSGGMHDFKASFDDLDEAMAYADSLLKTHDWVDVEDIEQYD